jgi:phage terminase large subunit GpA-like protein
MSQSDEPFYEALEVFAPPPDLTVSQWADSERRLSPESSSEPGQWSTDRAPYQREIMDSVKDPELDEICLMTSAQVGKTEMINNVVGYFVEHDPSPMLIVQPTLSMAEAYSKDRLSGMIRDTPALSRIIGSGKAKKTGNTLLHKSFPGGHITLAGSNSPASLASRPVRIVLFDEVDRFPYSAGAEGDPVTLGKKRTTTFLNRLSFLVSTPTKKGASRIELAFESSDKRLYFVPCPHCDHMQFLDHKHFYFNDDDPQDCGFNCQECGALIEHQEKLHMLRDGEWRKTGDKKSRVAGFHLNEFYSPWKTWAEIASDWKAAKKSEETLKAFYNTSLGLPYESMGDAPDWERLFKRKSAYKKNQIPNEVLFLTCGIDVQKDRLELEIVGWGTEKRSWSIDYRVIHGDTSQAKTFNELDSILSETWVRDDESRLSILRAAIDSGYQTQNVYQWARRFSESRVIVVKGQESLNAIFSMPKDIMKRSKKSRPLARVWNVGVSVVKRELFSWFKLDEPGEADQSEPFGFCHFPDEYGETYFKGLCSESENVKLVQGFPKYYFTKIYERNEPLDVRVYNRAAASTLGLDSLSNEGLENLFRASMELSGNPDPIKTQPRIKRKKSSYLK